MKYKQENVNPISLKTSDCVIRAIAKATNTDWITVYLNLCKLGEYMFSPPTSDIVYKEYLKRFETNTCKAKKGSPRKKVEDFTEGVYILQTANHLTCVIDNVNIDTWDNRKRCVYRYWRISK